YRDANVWMYCTYAGIALVGWLGYFAFNTWEYRFPMYVRDFLVIGMVGLVQSLAVGRRISIWLAVVLIFSIFVLSRLLPFTGQASSFAAKGESGYIEVPFSSTPTIKADPDGEYLVEKAPKVTDAELSAWAKANDFKVRRAFFPQQSDETLLDEYFVLDTKRANRRTHKLIEKCDLISYFEINEQIQVAPLAAEPTATSPRTSLGVNDPSTDQQWMMTVLDMTTYYELLRSTEPRKKAKIAILDTGVDAQHEDLQAVYSSTQSKYDNDPKGHGTHCAGIAAAATDNGIGIASPGGLPGFVEITSIKVLSAGGMGTQKTIIQGMIEAIDSGADIISMSLGGISNSARRRAYNQVVSYARRKNVIVIASAGNSNREATEYSPANTAGVICVSAIDNLMLRAPFSNRVGGVKMPIAAPGVGVYSTIPNSNYGAYSGTSMSCPFVAGIVGVMRSLQPELTTEEAYDILARTGKKTTEFDQLGPVIMPAAALREVL
ncbi:MAG: S8 family serine peptidase, partial [Bacteroidota bacterium]